MKIDFEKSDGLVPVVVQDFANGAVLMVAYMNEAAWHATVDSGYATFWSRSRNKLWLKGETSGNKLVVREAFTDCDQDAIVLKVDPTGPGVCHEGYETCFFRKLEGEEWAIIGAPVFDAKEVYR